MKILLHQLQAENFFTDATKMLPLYEKSLSAAHLIEQLPMAGFEIDGHEQLAHDTLLDISITANRGDCLSMRGIAREIACLNQLPFNDWILATPPAAWSSIITDSFVAIEAPDACPFYAAGMIRGISLQATAPDWMIQCLTDSGIQTIHPVVDIINYAMLQMGQPLHAFDAQKIKGLQLRYAKTGESFFALNGQKITLADNTLVVADGSAIQAIAGVIGAADLAVQSNTVDILLESAHFSPSVIAGRARQYGLQTEAAQRFERGVDPALPLLALNHAAALLIKYLGGSVETLYLPQPSTSQKMPPILLRAARIERLLGMSVAADQLQRILTALGMSCTACNSSEWQIIPPTFRFDVTLEVDVIEELARIYGYNQLPLRVPTIDQPAKAPPVYLAHVPQTVLVNRGYHEIISYSFISDSLQQICFPGFSSVCLQNPLSSELAVMRSSLWPSLVTTWQYNLHRKQVRARFFEVGRTYQPQWDEKTQSVVQNLMIAGLVSGHLLPQQWGASPQWVDFFDVKADVEAIFQSLGLADSLRFVAAEVPMLQAGQAAEIFLDDSLVGTIGRLHPKLEQHFALPGPVYLFELIYNYLQTKRIAPYQEISRFPSVRRDFAFLVAREQPVAAIIQFVKNQLGALCQEVVLFDIYQGKNIPATEKSIAFTVLLQDIQATLDEETVNRLSDQLIARLSQVFSIKIRDL